MRWNYRWKNAIVEENEERIIKEGMIEEAIEEIEKMLPIIDLVDLSGNQIKVLIPEDLKKKVETKQIKRVEAKQINHPTVEEEASIKEKVIEVETVGTVKMGKLLKIAVAVGIAQTEGIIGSNPILSYALFH